MHSPYASARVPMEHPAGDSAIASAAPRSPVSMPTPGLGPRPFHPAGECAGPTSVDQPSDDLFTVVRRHIQHNRYKEAEVILEANPWLSSSKDDHGNTLLAIACQNNRKRFAKLLLRHGADINGQNHQGNTPLHYCCSYSYTELADYLVSKKASKGARNSAGLVPSQMSVKLPSSSQDSATISAMCRNMEIGAPIRPVTAARVPRGPPPGMPPQRPLPPSHHQPPKAAMPQPTTQRPGTAPVHPRMPDNQTLRAAPEIWRSAVPVFHGGCSSSSTRSPERMIGTHGIKSSSNLKSTTVPVFHGSDLKAFMAAHSPPREAESEPASAATLSSHVPQSHLHLSLSLSGEKCAAAKEENVSQGVGSGRT